MKIVVNNSSDINSIDFIAALKEYVKGAEGTWYYDKIYGAHTDISRFF